MKKIVLFMLISLLLFFSISCADEVEPESITDALKISAWLLDENLEGTGYWAYSETPDYYGYWVSNDGSPVDSKDVFKFERLEPCKERIMAPMGYMYMDHVNLFLDFNGILDIEVGDEGDENVRLSYSLDCPEAPWNGEKIEENSVKALGPLTVSVNPIGKFVSNKIGHRDTLTDREYFINIRAYNYDETLIVTAKLKLTVLEDKAYPYQEIYFPIYGPNEERSRFLSIELVSYEYNDIYKFDETSK